ncbi:type II toxin-antitoxin system prevent-host-death family antitoxin [Dethiobacter alkaliphilus]|uniref:Prevent-host-death family protein n=1 Tax=Dethiobacter alkaliphilus AHT 1 TaxID=555088 RepID=C0GCB9_DETAL|nr:type II toxin-antitoxin system prevent-host-death family antitoxin [Dethiobacter alkaliphilus]EEG78854.1 prevent-host-death family protein [Dethiobacter alkaliphilus AHT 1]
MTDTTKVITATEFKTNLGKYIDYVMEDNEVVITKNGTKAVRLTPYITQIERYFTVKEKALDYQYGGKKVSYEEFMEIYENSELRMEYINGEIVLLGSPDTFHQNIAGNLHVQLREYLKNKKCKVFFAPFDVHFFKKDLNTPDVMQPDLLIACDVDEAVNEKGRYMGTPTLCIEILSKSTRSKDMVDKLNTFMLSGVREFWLVDPDKHFVLVYGFDNFEVDEYTTYKSGDVLESYFFKGLQIMVDEIFSL